MAKCANPLDLLLLLLTPLEQIERLAGRLWWSRRWRRLVVVVQQTVVGGGIVVVVVDDVVVVVVVGGVVVEEIVGRAGDSFCPSQVRQEAPGEGGALQTRFAKIIFFLPGFRSCQKVKRMYLPTSAPTSQHWWDHHQSCTKPLHTNPSHESWLAKKQTLLPCFKPKTTTHVSWPFFLLAF